MIWPYWLNLHICMLSDVGYAFLVSQMIHLHGVLVLISSEAMNFRKCERIFLTPADLISRIEVNRRFLWKKG